MKIDVDNLSTASKVKYLSSANKNNTFFKVE